MEQEKSPFSRLLWVISLPVAAGLLLFMGWLFGRQGAYISKINILGVTILLPTPISTEAAVLDSPTVIVITSTPSPTPISSALPAGTSPSLSGQGIDTPTPRPTLQGSGDEDFCPPVGSSEAMFSIPLEEMGTPIGSPVGTGVFEHAVRPFGVKPTPYRYVRDALRDHPCVQYLTPSVLLDSSGTRHCMTSFYHTNRIWVGSVLAGTSILVKKAGGSSYENIGQINQVAPDTRSYLVEYEIRVDDEICIEAPSGKVLADVIQAGGYQLWIGRDLEVYTDSWCLMLENDNSTHWCQ